MNLFLFEMDDWGWLPWLLLGAVLAFAFIGGASAARVPAPLYYPPPHRDLPRKAETKTYTNLEEWSIVKDRRGRVVGVKAKRRAEETG